ncbi:nuclear transport factor 2 family protein [Psychroserpens sp. BH13MA-6]
MKQYFLILCSVVCSIGFSQSNTEVFLFDIETMGSKIAVKNGKNLSNNDGYDNQPSFLDDRYILFASTRNGQTDIAKYDTRYGSKSWLNFTEGGEYTPLKVPNKDLVSAVRLDKDGKQRLYAYNTSNGESTELVQDLVVAYYTWFDDHTIVSAVIEGDDLNLYVHLLNEQINRKYATKVGRSIHRIPNSNLVSFISKENNNQWQIKALDPKTGKIEVIANTIPGVEDICWLNSTTILSGKESRLYKLTLQKDNDWKLVADLAENNISNITRLITENNTLLLAAEIHKTSATSEETDSDNVTTEASTVEAIVQQQLEAYNARDIDAFMATYSKDVKLYGFPNELQTDSYEAMRKSYSSWFESAPDLNAFIKKRIVIGNKVIDEEQVTANGKIFHAVAIYEINNGKISKVTFIQ